MNEIFLTASNACTLIAVLTACNLEAAGHKIRDFSLPPEEHKDTIALFMASIGEANETHLDMIRKGTIDDNTLNVTIPHACRAVQPSGMILSEMVTRKKNLSI